VGEAHPTSQMIARNYATLLARTGRFESAYRMLLPLRPHALASETRQDPIDHLERLASSAFYTGRVHAAYDAQLESIDLALGFHGAKSTRLAPRLDALAWMLFESGESGLAGRFAEASLALRPQGSQRSVLALALLPGDGALRQRALAAFDD